MYVPAASPDKFTEIPVLNDVVPLIEADSQLESVATVTGQWHTGAGDGGGHGVESETLTDCIVGFDPPEVPVNVREVLFGVSTYLSGVTDAELMVIDAG